MTRVFNDGVNLTLSAYPGYGYLEAMEEATRHSPWEPLLGHLKMTAIQLCPQNRGVLSIDLADLLRGLYPASQFRLHANVRVLPARQVIDPVDWLSHRAYWVQLARGGA